MTFAWYGHLRYKSAPLMLAVFASWGIVFEYCLQVPANRIGSTAFSTAQLKITPGGHHAGGVCGVLRGVSRRAPALELLCRGGMHARSGLVHVPRLNAMAQVLVR
jgi:hypothetical protein